MTRAGVLFAAAVLTLGTAAPAYAAETISLTVVAGHPPASTGVAGVRDFFIPEVDRRLAKSGKYKINWTQAYAGSVADVRGVLDAVQKGIGDLGYVPHLFNADKLPMEQLTYVAPFGTPDTQLLMKIIDELHQRVPAMRKAWESYNQRLLAPAGIDTYHFVLKEPIESLADLKGKRIGVAGLATNWLRESGAIPVSGSLPEYYNSLQTGLLDGVITFESAIPAYKFNEVAPYIATIDFGSMYSSGLTVNLDVWKDLPDEVKTVMSEVASEYRDRVGESYRTSGERAMKKVVGEGAKILQVPAADRKAYAERMPNIAQEWASDLDKRGLPGSEIIAAYMELLRKNNVEIVRNWDAK